ncbi:MAG: protein of unknown function with transrane region [Parcubacteria group bacterium]|nr:protein of unknown function with transrane region [Parcubacteria group bacterium]
MKKIISIVSLYALPIFAFADVTDANSLFSTAQDILKKILPLIISVAVIYFVYNAFSYMIAADEEKKGEAKSKMIYGIIALFVMVSVWGLVGILSGTFGFSTTNAPTLPGLPSISGGGVSI